MPRTLIRTKDFFLSLVPFHQSSYYYPHHDTPSRLYCIQVTYKNEATKKKFHHSSPYLQKLSRHHFIINNTIILGYVLLRGTILSAVILEIQTIISYTFVYFFHISLMKISSDKYQTNIRHNSMFIYETILRSKRLRGISTIYTQRPRHEKAND